MAIVDLKSDLSQIRVKVKRNLTDTTLPRTNMRDANGNIEIKYDEKNKFQVPLDRSNSKLEIHWDSIKDSYYARGQRTNDTLGIRNDKFGSTQPYVIKEIGDKWGPEGGFFSGDMGLVRGGTGTLAGRVAGDSVRTFKFLTENPGFTVKQYGLQAMNVGGDLGARANIYNPISPLLNTVPLLHFERHIDIPIASDIIRQGFVGSSALEMLHLGSHKKNARYKELDALGALKSVIGIGGEPSLKDIENTEQVRAIGQQGVERPNNDVKSITADLVNLVPYGSKTDKELKESENSDFVPFRFKDVNNNKYIVFRALLSGITDNMTPEFAAERYVGRPDQVYVYQGTNREISFTFDIYPKSKSELPVLWEKLNYLVGLVYPSWAPSGGGMGMIAPFIELTIGDMYKDTPGFLSQLSLTVQDGTTWEIDDWKLPKYIQANCSFTYIGKYLPNQVGKHYELPWLKDENEMFYKTDGIGTFTDVTPGWDTVNETGYPTRHGFKINKLFGELGQPQ